MLASAATSYALFAAVFGLLCVVSAVLVTDAMLRGCQGDERKAAPEPALRHPTRRV